MSAAERTRRPGYAAGAWALLFAIPSLYWGLGGEAGLDSIAAQPGDSRASRITA